MKSPPPHGTLSLKERAGAQMPPRDVGFRARTEADELSAGEIFADGSRAWMSQLPAFAGVALLLHAPLLLLTFLPRAFGIGSILAFIVAELAVAVLVEAALVKAVLDGARGLQAEFAELLEPLRKAPVVLALRARVLVGIAARTLLFVVPGLKYLSETFAAVPAVVVKGGSIQGALRESERLTEGVRFRVFAVCAVTWVIAAIMHLAFRFPSPGRINDTTLVVIYLCVRALDRSWAATLSAMTYHHLCARNEA
jgi:hypothetical protein